ncbi:aldehyde dehydrogenase family protein [Mycolicibacterium litorale]|uniref:aldehyde dehydrogenase family protein n=1 Tax=Mycolicibacterium litorale TaxID=758802 RepID=UPI003CE9F04D
MSPSTEEVVGTVPSAGPRDVDAAVAAARAAFDDPHGWSSWEPAKRAAALEQLADELAARADDMARRVSTQNGMPISFSRNARVTTSQGCERALAVPVRRHDRRPHYATSRLQMR